MVLAMLPLFLLAMYEKRGQPLKVIAGNMIQVFSLTPKEKVKLSRAEIAALIQQAKGDGKKHTAQQTIPYETIYPNGICRVRGRLY